MTLKEAYEHRRQESLALKRQVKKLEKELEKASAGLFTPDEKVSLIKHSEESLKASDILCC